MRTTIYRRHSATCPHAGAGSAHKRCKCQIWIYATEQGIERRQSLKTRDWDRAKEMERAWSMGKPAAANERVMPTTIQEACAATLAEKRDGEKLAAATLKKYRVVLDQFQAFSESKGLAIVDHITAQAIADFRASWKDGAISAAKKRERLIAICAYWERRGWIDKNFAKDLKPPKVYDAPTLPYTREEMARLVAACDLLGANDRVGQMRMLALILTLRCTGLRVTDAVTLHKSRVREDQIFLRMQKTRVPILVPIPQELRTLLAAVEQANGYYFWTGVGSPDTAAGKWRRKFARLAALAKVSGAHFHRFRDTFAVELLNSGVDLKMVSELLGHQSVAITEKHYLPFVQSRAERLEAAVMRSLKANPIPGLSVAAETPAIKH